jgi:5-methylcytosine-specific restriction protein A
MGRDASLDGGWQSLRAAQLQREPHCRACAAAGRMARATHVDHIISRRQRPDLAREPDNLQSLCARRHNAKTNRIDAGFGGKHGRPSMR